MIEELKNLLEGKQTTIKNKQYLSTKEYIQPFLNRLDQFKPTYVCQVKMPDQLSITNGHPDLIYNRVHIQAVMPESFYFQSGMRKVIGMIYGLDIKNPVAKFYIADYDSHGNIVAFTPSAGRNRPS